MTVPCLILAFVFLVCTVTGYTQFLVCVHMPVPASNISPKARVASSSLPLSLSLS